ncbi:MAG: DUF255 domain-containing protein, partial [Halothiobacillus sp.]|nr:DUF255 domain-containing protein [Halothiobacillus sp.]
MKRYTRWVGLFSVLLLLPQWALAADIHWQPYGPAVFAKAKAENRLILLDMVAVWCHWCHVMEDKTYSDPA